MRDMFVREAGIEYNLQLIHVLILRFKFTTKYRSAMYSTVFVTVPDMDTARNLARKLVERKLVACANIFPVTSIYTWEGNIEENTECIMLLKICTENFEDVKEEILRMHPYDLPCIVRYAINDGHKKYLEWISETTGQGGI